VNGVSSGEAVESSAETRRLGPSCLEAGDG
jgi:hypothetical protein